MLKLSIITINRNNAIGLRKTIESVISQTFTDFEYIIIDGASTDDSVDVIKEYESSLSYWISEPDNGIYNAMNKGILKAKGEYLLFLNSGDWLFTDYTINNVFCINLNEDILCGNSLMLKSKLHSEWLKQSPNNIKASDVIINSLPHQATFIRKALFNQIGLYNENFQIVSDWEFFIKAILMNDKSYKHLNIIISSCETEGISSQETNCHIVENEEKLVLEKLQKLYKLDYFELKEARKYKKSADYKLFKDLKEKNIILLINRLKKIALKFGYFKLKSKTKDKIIYYKTIYNDFMTKLQIRNEIKKWNISDISLKKDDSIKEVIVSLTSHGYRVEKFAPYAIFKIFKQKTKPNRIILSLNKNVWNDNNLPNLLKELQKFGLEIYYTEDIGPHTKLVPVLQKNSDSIIITIDDDIYYNDNLISNLLKTYKETDRKTVICNTATIVEKNNGIFKPYTEWMSAEYGNEYTEIIAQGVGGILYPPNIFDKEIENISIIKETAPFADDLWFWAMEKRLEIRVVKSKYNNKYLDKNISVIETYNKNKSIGLYFKNLHEGRDNIQFSKLIDYYKIK